MKKVKSFDIILQPEKIWLRNEFRLLGSNKIRDFVVQFEIVEDKKHLTPIRYDFKHGYFHRDIINQDGKHIEKKEFNVSSLEEAAKIAIDDLMNNWKSLLKKGGYTDLESKRRSLPGDTMRKAKEYLINLIQHPEKIEYVPNKVNLDLLERVILENSVNLIVRDKTGNILVESTVKGQTQKIISRKPSGEIEIIFEKGEIVYLHCKVCGNEWKKGLDIHQKFDTKQDKGIWNITCKKCNRTYFSG